MNTHGAAFDEALDCARLEKQRDRVRDWMLEHGEWRTLAEIREALRFADSSISAQLRHLRKPRFGSYRVEKRRRGGGTWEYRVSPAEQLFALNDRRPASAEQAPF